MKPLYRLLIAVLFLGTVLGVMYWPKKTAPAAATPAAAPLASVNVGDVQKIEVNTAGQPAAVLVRDGSDWKLVQPYAAAGDDAAVIGMLGTLGNITGAQDVGPVTNPAAFGFDQPGEVKLDLSNGQTTDFQFGNDTPTGGSTYIRMGANGPIKIIPNYVKENALKSAFMLQDKKIVHAPTDQVTAIDVTYQGKKVSLQHTNGQWPAAQKDAVQPLLDALNDGQMTAMTDPTGKAAAQDGLNHPTATLKLTWPAGSAELTIGDKKGAAEYYARATGSPAVFTVSDYIVTDMSALVTPAKAPAVASPPGIPQK